jgi:succinate dehydrogenase membrane anchor subunit
MSLRSPLGQVVGHGAAGEGVGHWWAQRVSAVALALLAPWFLVSLLALRSVDHAAVTAWLHAPLHAVLAALLCVALAFHSELGIQVVIEDYIAARGLRVTALLASRFAHVLAGAIGVFAILRIALGGVA